MTTPAPRPVYVAKPPKKVSEMTDAERRQWLEQVYDDFVERQKAARGG